MTKQLHSYLIYITLVFVYHNDHHWIIFCLHAQHLSKSIKSLDYTLPWFIAFITLRKFCSSIVINILSLGLFLSVRNYLSKSPFCWLNLHLQTLKIIILRKQQIMQCWFSFLLVGSSKRLQKPYNTIPRNSQKFPTMQISSDIKSLELLGISGKGRLQFCEDLESLGIPRNSQLYKLPII